MRIIPRPARGLGAHRRDAWRSPGTVASETFEAPNEIAGDALGVERVEVRGAEVAVLGTRGEHGVDGAEDLVRDGDGGTLVAAPRLEPVGE